MAILSPLRFFYMSFAVYIAYLFGNSYVAAQERKVHIVYMGGLREGEVLTSTYHTNMLRDVVDSNALGQALIRSYTRSFNGFAANLTEEERQKLASLDEVGSVFPSRTLQPQTTGSWDFIGLHENLHRKPLIESDVIIGVIDTGIWPESKSFSDEGFGPPPKKWRGECNGGLNFTCNKKIIGARYFIENSARDTDGHGSHTASTAAGNSVKDTSFFGIASGTARGGVPSARIAAYKVCSRQGCLEEGILAAFDDAVADGVDIITISIGGESPFPLSQDVIAIGSFHAMEKGILTLQSAGNNGSPGLVSSVAPWLFSVAASSTDRRIVTKIVLGNGKTLIGNAVNSFELNGTKFPLISGKNASTNCTWSLAESCFDYCIDSNLVKGKIVLCQTRDFYGVHKAGAIGSIGLTSNAIDVSFVTTVPATLLTTDQDFALVEEYINSTDNPQESILKSEAVQDLDAPVVASFSSKGPNKIVEQILKPDITAPGVDILAAYSPVSELVPSDILDRRHSEFSVLSGTSMSCPHAAGAAAYVKTFHPDWSPSTIRSVLMTTAWRMNATKNREGEFAYGAGHIDPLKAVNPGLVYETTRDDYIKMLCMLGDDEASLRRIIGANVTCPTGEEFAPKDMNYPSMCYLHERGLNFSVQFPRSVTNVGFANSTYKAKITSPPQCNIRVEPDTLSFQALNEKKSFVVYATGVLNSKPPFVSASLDWFDGTHFVRSPIVVSKPIGFFNS